MPIRLAANAAWFERTTIERALYHCPWRTSRQSAHSLHAYGYRSSQRRLYPQSLGAEVEQGRLYGLGAAYTKAQIAAFVYAARAVQLTEMRLAGTTKLAFVVDEETGACSPYGTRYLLEQGLLDGDAALVGEPGDEKIALGHRGIYRFRVQTQGEAIHTGLRAWEEGIRGHNAVNDMARLILVLEQCTLPFLPSPLFPGRKPVLSFPTMIQGGNSVNMVPAGCEAFGDVRVLPGMTEDDIRQAITACLDQAHVPYKFTPLVFVPAAALSEEAEIVQIVSSAIEEITGKRVRCAGAGPACDGWMFLERGIPAICGYGVACGGVHGADEWADLVSLRQVTEAYARTIVTFFRME